jgi:hypothetical protein
MTPITNELLDRYIHNAQLVARSKSERLAVTFAADTTKDSTGATIVHRVVAHCKDSRETDFVRDPSLRQYKKRNRDVEAANRAKAVEEVLSWRGLILREINAALCTRSRRYKKEVSAIRHSADVLILAIAAAVAKALEVNIVVIAAMVAALLRMVLSMGVSVFCKRSEAGLF